MTLSGFHCCPSFQTSPVGASPSPFQLSLIQMDSCINFPNSPALPGLAQLVSPQIQDACLPLFDLVWPTDHLVPGAYTSHVCSFPLTPPGVTQPPRGLRPLFKEPRLQVKPSVNCTFPGAGGTLMYLHATWWNLSRFLCDPMDSSLHQAPPSMGFSRQEYWSGLPFPSPGNVANPGIVVNSEISLWLARDGY